MRTLLMVMITSALPATAIAAQASPPTGKTTGLVELSGEIHSLAQRIAPAVVQVVVSGYRSFDQTSGHPVSLFGREETTGSGVIVDSQGYIVTNAHVVRGAVNTTVVLARTSGREESADAGDLDSVDAKIIGIDTESDLAVLKIERNGLTALRFMNSDHLRQGDFVLAIGAPMGLRNSVSFGVVSAPARSIDEQNPMVYVQTDASINPGNSGGALVSMSGLLVGLNSFILTQSGGNEGLGFAIPANTVQDVYRQLRKDGHVHRGEIGVYAQNITPVMAKGLSLAHDHGVILADVDEDGPADEAGLKRGDVVLTLNGQRLQTASQFENHIFRRQAGDKLRLTILRGETQLEKIPVVRDREDKASLLTRLAHPEKNLVARLGILCIEIDKDVAALLPGLRRQYGLVVAAKAAGGQSQFIDLQPGDIIDAVNTLPVAFLDTLRSTLSEMKPGDPVVLQIERDGRFQYLAFELDR
ncbi:MAG TPA: trypsin-like peptidase domain-containing protein [Bryobacteraceae bacterium]|nr:trypsin-like peptidase domain-containing protein [Bryobacteraceae bacterium]